MQDIPNDLVMKLQKFGIKNPNNPSAEDMKIIFDSYLKSKKLSVDAFQTYVNSITPTLKILFDGLQQFAAAQANVSNQTLTIINSAVTILSAELNKDLSTDEKKEIRDKIISLVQEARKESENHNNLMKKLAYIGGGVALVAIGAVVVIVTGGRNMEIVKQGGKLIARAVMRI
jgi:CII-binding regulator of phage lambda lysogenization HflD